MAFHCIVCNSDKSTSHLMKDAKSGDLIFDCLLPKLWIGSA